MGIHFTIYIASLNEDVLVAYRSEQENGDTRYVYYALLYALAPDIPIICRDGTPPGIGTVGDLVKAIDKAPFKARLP